MMAPVVMDLAQFRHLFCVDTRMFDHLSYVTGK